MKKGDIFAKDSIYVFAIVVIITAFFHRTIFQGKPVSKIGLVEKADSLFDPSMKSASYGCAFDPSLYQLHAPVNILTERILKTGNLPLWNPDNGCGQPLVGDPQSFLLSPFRLLFPVSNFYWYNLGLVLEVTIGCFALFYLARSLALARPAALMAALAYNFAPFYLWYFELPNHFALYPLTLLLFVNLARKDSVFVSLLSGAGCAILVYTMHPECSFYAIAFSTFSYLLITFPGSKSAALKKLGLVALTAICLSAPLLSCFFEFVTNSTSYKADGVSMGGRPLDWFALILNQLYPANGREAPFPGALITALIPVAIIYSKNRFKNILIVLLVSTFLFVSQPGPLAQLISVGPLSALVPSYAIPLFLLTATLLGACGLDALVQGQESEEEQTDKRVAAAIASAVIVAASPILLSVLAKRLPFLNIEDLYVPPLSTMLSDAPELKTASLIATFALIAVLLFFTSGKRSSISYPLAFLLVLFNLGSQYSLAALAMQPGEPFQYKCPEIINKLKELKGRSLATGIHTYLPNNNQVFGTSDLRLYNPFFPEGYLNFIKAAGAEKHDLYLWGFNSKNLNALINCAAIKYVIADTPPMQPKDQDFKDCNSENGSVFSYFPAKKAIYGMLELHNEKNQELQYGIFSEDGKEIWSSPWQLIQGADQSKLIPISIPILKSLNEGEVIYPGFHLKSEKKVDLSKSRPIVISASASDLEQAARSRFKLLFEDNHGYRIYENLEALPEAFFVQEAIVVKDRSKILDLLKSENFDPRQKVILENNEETALAKPGTNSIADAEVSLRRPGPNKVLIDLKCNGPGYLVLADTWYPGWRARLDRERDCKILRANYLFKAVAIETSGHHQIEFDYFPDSLKIGLAIPLMFLAGLTGLVAVNIHKKKGQQDKQKTC